MKLADALLVFALATAPMATQNAQQVARALESHYRHASTLKAAFLERFTDGSGAVASESGTVYFSRPGRMRWDYESPEPKLFLVDGTNVWFYVPADRTASRAKLKESSDWRTPLALLTGKADLSRLCRQVALVQSEGDPGSKAGHDSNSREDSLLRCLPRTTSDDSLSSLHEILFESDRNSRLVRVVIREAGNIETEFRFGGWEENLPIPESTFHFQPPPGVTIVDEATLAGGVHLP